jgi:hypothetical protein
MGLLMDPRLKCVSHPIVSVGERTKAINIITNLLKSRMNSSVLNVARCSNVYSSAVSVVSQHSDPNDFSAYMTPMLHPTVLGEDTAESIMSRYLEMPPPEKDETALQWWTSTRVEKELKELVVVALDILIIPATSASIERTFSASGNFITAKRSNISPNTIKSLLQVKLNTGKLL